MSLTHHTQFSDYWQVIIKYSVLRKRNCMFYLFLYPPFYLFLGENTVIHTNTQLQGLAELLLTAFFCCLWPYLACVWRGQQRQPEVATLLIQANVLLTTAQLHRTPAERGERSRRRGWGPRVGAMRSVQKGHREQKKKEDDERPYETKAGKRRRNTINT